MPFSLNLARSDNQDPPNGAGGKDADIEGGIPVLSTGGITGVGINKDDNSGTVQAGNQAGIPSRQTMVCAPNWPVGIIERSKS